MNEINYERFLFRQVSENRPTSPRYGAAAVTSQMRRGDEAIAEDDWETAENCYVASYFLNGGRGPVILSKIELSKQLIAVASVIAEAGARVESARYTPDVLKLLITELDKEFDTVYALRMELPRSQRLINLEAMLDDIIRRARQYASA